MAQKYTDKQRDRILAAARTFLVDQGINVGKLECEAAQQRAARREFSKPLAAGVSSIFKTIPEGNTEHIQTRFAGGTGARCQAKSRRSGGQQCGRVAVSGFRVCSTHGARAHGRKTKEGIARSAAHLVDHGRETREKRKRRSELSNERRALELQMIAMGQAMPAIRGPRTSGIERYLKQRKKTELAAQKKAKLKLGLP